MSMQKDNVIYDKHANDSNARKGKYLLYAMFKSQSHLSQRKECFFIHETPLIRIFVAF
jgi:hypothetical protein